jgi:hypothetical protein
MISLKGLLLVQGSCESQVLLLLCRHLLRVSITWVDQTRLLMMVLVGADEMIHWFLPLNDWSTVNLVRSYFIRHPIRRNHWQLLFMRYHRSRIHIAFVNWCILTESFHLSALTLVYSLIIAQPLDNCLLEVSTWHSHLRDRNLIQFESLRVMIEVWAAQTLLGVWVSICLILQEFIVLSKCLLLRYALQKLIYW